MGTEFNCSVFYDVDVSKRSMLWAGFPKVGQVAPMGVMKVILGSKKGAINSKWESWIHNVTYIKYFGVDDEEQKKI